MSTTYIESLHTANLTQQEIISLVYQRIAFDTNKAIDTLLAKRELPYVLTHPGLESEVVMRAALTDVQIFQQLERANDEKDPTIYHESEFFRRAIRSRVLEGLFYNPSLLMNPFIWDDRFGNEAGTIRHWMKNAEYEARSGIYLVRTESIEQSGSSRIRERFFTSPSPQRLKAYLK